MTSWLHPGTAPSTLVGTCPLSDINRWIQCCSPSHFQLFLVWCKNGYVVTISLFTVSEPSCANSWFFRNETDVSHGPFFCHEVTNQQWKIESWNLGLETIFRIVFSIIYGNIFFWGPDFINSAPLQWISKSFQVHTPFHTQWIEQDFFCSRSFAVLKGSKNGQKEQNDMRHA